MPQQPPEREEPELGERPLRPGHRVEHVEGLHAQPQDRGNGAEECHLRAKFTALNKLEQSLLNRIDPPRPDKNE